MVIGPVQPLLLPLAALGNGVMAIGADVVDVLSVPGCTHDDGFFLHLLKQECRLAQHPYVKNKDIIWLIIVSKICFVSGLVDQAGNDILGDWSEVFGRNFHSGVLLILGALPRFMEKGTQSLPCVPFVPFAG